MNQTEVLNQAKLGFKYLAVDTETTGLTFFDTPFCVTIAWIDENGECASSYFELPNSDLPGILKSAENLVFHNAKFDLQKLHLVGILDYEMLNPANVWDTECLAHLLDEHRKKGLKDLARDLLGEETDEEEVVRAAFRKAKLKKADGYHQLDREIIKPYALKDAEFTIRLFNLLYPGVADNQDLSRLNGLEQRLTFTLLRMERRGMGVDTGYVEETARAYAAKALALELAIRNNTGNEDFNPNSPKQIVEAFAALGIELESTGKAELKQVNHPLAQEILELRTLRKMHGTYLKAILAEQRDGILHPWYRQHGTRTGRMSSGAAEQ